MQDRLASKEAETEQLRAAAAAATELPASSVSALETQLREHEETLTQLHDARKEIEVLARGVGVEVGVMGAVGV